MCSSGLLAAEIGLPVWGTPANFKWVSRVGFATATTSLNGCEPNFVRCLAVSWVGTLCIHFLGLLPLREFCQVQTSLCVQVLHYPILAALLRGTRAPGVSQTLRHGIFMRQGGQHWAVELSSLNRVSSICANPQTTFVGLPIDLYEYIVIFL